MKVSVFYDRLTAAWLGGAEVEVVYLAEGLSDEQAFALETLEIETRKGLWNVAPGGIGFRSSTAKRMWAEHREKITAAQSGRTKPGTAANLVSLWENPEYRARMSAVAKATWSDKREVMCAKRRETWANPEYRAMMKAKSQAAWTPERRAAFAKRRKAQAATPEGHAQLVEASRRSRS